MDQGTAEEKRSVKNRIAHHHQKEMSLIEQRIHHMDEQKKNQWRGALFGFFVQILSQAAQALNFLAPGLGVAVSTAIGLLEKINPFSHKAQDAQLEAEKTQAEIQQEGSQKELAQGYLQNWEAHEDQIKKRMDQTRENLEASQEAAVRI
jgi:chromosome segregation ATPase